MQLQWAVTGNDSRCSLTLPMDCCTLYGDSACLLFNVENIVTMFSKFRLKKKEYQTDYTTNGSVMKASLRNKARNCVIIRTDGRTYRTGLGRQHKNRMLVAGLVQQER